MSLVAHVRSPLTPEQQSLVTSHLRLAAMMTNRRLRSSDRSSADWQDAYQDMVMALMEAASRWKPDAGKTFTSYAWSILRWRGARASARFMRDAAVVTVEVAPDETLTPLTERLADPTPTADELLESAETLASGMKLVAKLEPHDRATVARLVDGEPVAPGTAARIRRLLLGVSPENQTVRTKFKASDYNARWMARLTPAQREHRRLRNLELGRARYRRLKAMTRTQRRAA
jgi:hypothetical protein